MTRVVAAAGEDNPLGSRDIAGLKRLKQAGDDVKFFYYLPKVPAEFSMLPSVNDMLKSWRQHAKKMLDELGRKLNIPSEDRYFIDEAGGPGRVLDEAKRLQADVIVTSDKSLLTQNIIGAVYDWVASLFKGGRVPVENVEHYVTEHLGPEKREVPPKEKAEAHEEPVHGPLWAKSTQPKKTSEQEKTQELEDTKQEDTSQKIRRR